MSVVITIDVDTADEARDIMRTLLNGAGAIALPASSYSSSDKTETTDDSTPRQGRIMQPTVDTGGAVEMTAAEVTTPAPKRPRKPKAEPAPVAPTPPTPPSPPEPGSDEYEDAKRDAADEAAETETTADVTLDDVRNAVAPYIAKWTIAVAQADVGHLIKDIGGADKISELDPNNQENLRKLVAALNKASASDTRYVKAA